MESISGVVDRQLRLFDLVVRHEMTIWARVEGAVDQATGVRLGSFQVLRVLGRRAGDGRVQDVAVELGITVGAASKIVDRLVQRSLVDRRPDPHDGRSSLIAVTQAGHAILGSGLRAMSQALDAHLSVLDEPEVAGLTRLLTDLADAPSARVGGV